MRVLPSPQADQPHAEETITWTALPRPRRRQDCLDARPWRAVEDHLLDGRSATLGRQPALAIRDRVIVWRTSTGDGSTATCRSAA